MATKLAQIGFGSFLSLEHSRRALNPHSTRVQKLVREQKAKGSVIDLTSGRRTTAVIPLIGGHLVLVAAHPKKLQTQGLFIDVATFRRTPSPK